ncbi:MAG TPA: response regulator [Polyangiaceae bacterium]|nr:response regulator [Polyangiaceae bacterium]
MVIDDEVLLGQTLQLGLEETFDVELELSGRRGLERLLSGEKFDLVLCDLSLPDLHGSAIHRAVAAERPGLLSRFVVMTGGAVTVEARGFVDSYRGPLLDKPFTLTDVERLAQSLLGPSSRPA